MLTGNVVLTNEQANLIQSLDNSGRYQNASEVIREGLRLIERGEAEDAAPPRLTIDSGLGDTERKRLALRI